MTSTLTTIARTISDELERAVAAAEEAQNAGLDAANNEMKSALSQHEESILAAMTLEREAAQLVSKAIKLREQAQTTLYDQLAGISERVSSLRSSNPRRIKNGKSKASTTNQLPIHPSEAQGE